MRAVCSIEGCGKPVHGRGWCNNHYKHWQKHGDPLGGGPTRDTSPIPEGSRFGRGLVLSEAHDDRRNHKRHYNMLCDPAAGGCGQEYVVSSYGLKSGTRSCGCLRDERTAVTGRANRVHGHASDGGRTPTYESFGAATARCTSSNHPHFKHYGGADPPVEFRYASFEDFLADLGERPVGTTLGRILDIGHYEPGRCAWQSWKQQGIHKRLKGGLRKKAQEREGAQ